MAGFLLIASGVAAICAWRLIASGGCSAWLALLVAVAAFGGEPTDPLRALVYAAVAFPVLSFLRRAR